MTTAAIKKKLHDFIEQAESEKVKAMYVLLKNEIEESQIADHWEDKDFVKEMDRRMNEYKTGKAKLVSFEEAHRKAKKVVAKSRSGKTG